MSSFRLGDDDDDDDAAVASPPGTTSLQAPPSSSDIDIVEDATSHAEVDLCSTSRAREGAWDDDEEEEAIIDLRGGGTKNVVKGVVGGGRGLLNRACGIY